MWKLVKLLCQDSNSLTPTGYMFQLGSHRPYKLKGKVPPYFRCHLQLLGPPILLTDQLLTLRLSITPSGSIICYNNSQNSLGITILTEALYLWLQFYYKGYNSGTVKLKRHKGQGLGERRRMKSLCPLLVGSNTTPFPALSMCSLTRKRLLSFDVQRFIEVLVCRHNWSLPCDWTR